MSIRRQKNITTARDELLRLIDTRDVVLAKLVRLTLKIDKLKRRLGRAEKARVGKHDPQNPVSMAGEAYPRRYDPVEVPDEMDDAIPF